MRSATTTLAAPLATSRTATSTPAVTPDARNTFAAPTFPLPMRRRSRAPQRRASNHAKGVDPRPYATRIAIVGITSGYCENAFACLDSCTGCDFMGVRPSDLHKTDDL